MTRTTMLMLACAAVIAGCVPPGAKVRMPIVLQVKKHEAELFAWRPPFSVNVPNFDSRSRPYIRSRTANRDETRYVETLSGSAWLKHDLIGAVKAAYPEFAGTRHAAGWWPSRIVFDRDDHAYTLLRIRLADKTEKNLLLYSRDQCKTWKLCELPDGEFSIEHWTGHNEIPGPPPIAILTKLKDHPAKWASVMRLSVLFPRKTAEGIEPGKPVAITDRCFGMSQHSGGASFAATRDGKTHIVWGEVTYVPGEKPQPYSIVSINRRGQREHLTLNDPDATGSPTFIVTYDHKTGKLGEKLMLAYAPPANDCHNTPGVALDSEGILHVITGAHGDDFYYVRSRKPNDTSGAWEAPKPILRTGWKGEDGKEKAKQTYLAMVIDQNDTIHVAFRQWRQGLGEYHGGKQYAALSYQRKRKRYKWEDARPLVVAPLPGYSIFYHKLALDHRGRVYLAYSYLSFTEPYKSLPDTYNFRSMLVTRDGGTTWGLATTRDFR